MTLAQRRFFNSFSVGYALLLTRGGLLLSSLISSMPAWRLIDPLHVLARLGAGKREEGEDEESLDSLVSQETKAAGPDPSLAHAAQPGEAETADPAAVLPEPPRRDR